MTTGLSMALHEESVRDHRFGHIVTQDFTTYHIASRAGEIGIGSAAAVVNAIYHAAGVRVRDLPVHCDALLN